MPRVLKGTSQIGVLIHSANAVTHHANIQGIRVEGDGTGTGIRVEGACADVEITGGRFFKLAVRSVVRQASPERTVKARVASNTIYERRRRPHVRSVPSSAPRRPARRNRLPANSSWRWSATTSPRRRPWSTRDRVGIEPDSSRPTTPRAPTAGRATSDLTSLESELTHAGEYRPSDRCDVPAFRRGPPRLLPNNARVGAP